MKNIHVIILGFLVVFLAILFGAATLQSTEKFRFKVSASEMLEKLIRENHLISPAKIAGQLGQGNMMIDVRDPKSYLNYHLRNSINIPLERLLDDENLSLFEDGTSKILICNDGRLSNSAWMILNQFGISNLKVLDGGINAMNTFLNNKNNVNDTQLGDEVIKFDLDKMTGKTTAHDSPGMENGVSKSQNMAAEKEKK
jgi:rhodanese-related sulfurtransferase